MKLDYAAPSADLADYISAFYLFEAEIDQFEDIERADIGQLRFVLEGSGEVHFADVRVEPFRPLSLFGPTMAASRIVARGPKVRLFGYGLLPAGWGMTVRKPADECADQVFVAADMIKMDLGGLLEEIRALATLAEMVEVVSERARRFYAEAPTSPLWFIRATDQWLESSVAPDIADLEAATGLSRRQIERLCRQHYGAPPKFLVRKYRALRTANLIAHGNEDWQDLIGAAYYDQSHFIREIKEFTGMTPSAVRDARSPVSTLVYGRSQLAGLVSPLVSET